MKNIFANIGMGTIVQRARIMFIAPPGTTTATKYIEDAKNAKPSKYHNATLGHRYRSVIVLDDGTVIMSTIKPLTLMKRLNAVDVPENESEDVEEEENEDEEE